VEYENLRGIGPHPHILWGFYVKKTLDSKINEEDSKIIETKKQVVSKTAEFLAVEKTSNDLLIHYLMTRGS
jgi:hypothetical protein